MSVAAAHKGWTLSEDRGRTRTLQGWHGAAQAQQRLDLRTNGSKSCRGLPSWRSASPAWRHASTRGLDRKDRKEVSWGEEEGHGAGEGWGGGMEALRQERHGHTHQQLSITPLPLGRRDGASDVELSSCNHVIYQTVLHTVRLFVRAGLRTTLVQVEGVCQCSGRGTPLAPPQNKWERLAFAESTCTRS